MTSDDEDLLRDSLEDFSDKSLLIVDDDERLCVRLARAMERRGFVVRTALTVGEGVELARQQPPTFAVIDYGNIATAVAAVKVGATDYLSKPADADQIEAALLTPDGALLPPPPDMPMSADRVRWEHIQRVYEQCDRNVSETARRLRMHRRTLQRILAKYAPRG